MNRKQRLILCLIVMVILAFAYHNILHWLFVLVKHREGSSHGIFVPFISGYFIWRSREDITKAKAQSSFLSGGAIVLLGFLLFFLSRGMEEIFLQALSYFVVAAGVVLALFGMELFKHLSLPLFFLVTMIPLPKSMYNQVAEWMQAVTTMGSVWFLQLVHFPIYSEGFNIFLPDINLVVNRGCSGIRYLISFVVFSIAYGFFFKQGMKSRILVVLAAFPISIFGSILRLCVIFIAARYVGPYTLEGMPHLLLSWSVFLVTLVGAIGIDQAISRRQLAVDR